MDALIALLAVGFIGGAVAAVAIAGKYRAQSRNDPDGYLDQLFNGAETVSYWNGAGRLPLEQVVTGGKRRGYRLLEMSGNSGRETVLFSRD